MTPEWVPRASWASALRNRNGPYVDVSGHDLEERGVDDWIVHTRLGAEQRRFSRFVDEQPDPVRRWSDGILGGSESRATNKRRLSSLPTLEELRPLLTHLAAAHGEPYYEDDLIRVLRFGQGE